MHASIWVQKRLQSIAVSLGIAFKVNFRANRRTAFQEHGGALATAQSLLRHASSNTTAGIYSEQVRECVWIAVNSYEGRVSQQANR
jgi:hypothetical protein